MKYLVVICVLLSISFSSKSALIGADDIDSTSFDLPTGWTAVNESALFDGVIKRFGGSRFVGFRNNGEALTNESPFQINVEFTDLFDISSFAFYNDWGHHLQQQVASITIDFLDSASNTIFSNTRADVQLDTFDIVDVFSTTNTIKGVAAISVKIADIQKTNFEIREFVLQATRSSLASLSGNQVSAPLSALFLIILSALYIRNRRNV